jgi:Tfp pilus assembly protein PilF
MSLGRTRSAERAAQAAVDSNPAESRAHTILGFVHLTQIDTKKARADFEAAIERDSSDPLPRLGLGLAMIRQGDLVGGREQIEIAVILDPSNSLIRSYVGKAYYEENTSKRDELAATQFGIARQLDPKDPTPWFYDAILKQTQNRPVEALQDLQKSQ